MRYLLGEFVLVFFPNAALKEEVTQRQNYGRISVTPVLTAYPYLGKDRPDHFQLGLTISHLGLNTGLGMGLLKQ